MLNFEQRKQRKRKLSDHNVTGTEKVPKEEIYRKKNELLDQEDQDEDMAAEEQDGPAGVPQEEELNTSNSFSMNKFRERLRTGEFITGMYSNLNYYEYPLSINFAFSCVHLNILPHRSSSVFIKSKGKSKSYCTIFKRWWKTFGINSSFGTH